MKTDITPRKNQNLPTRLKDYKSPNFKIETVYLSFDLSPSKTRVKSKMQVKRLTGGPLCLNGENIDLVSLAVNGQVLSRSKYRLTQEQLILENLPESCTIEIENTLDPSANKALMGLYVSGGRFCTQCEAEGFRRITYYLDRPDVMSVFTVRIEADKTLYPYLLANGNMTDSGDVGSTRHFAIWHDPFPKPAYLFALVAGEFDLLEDRFKTMSGRDIPLTIYVDPGDAPRAEYAMDSLKRAMKWDEQAYGREYDLDRFMIVAVRDFNFGAMENKGLNIFNSSLLLADAKTATDVNFERIESVVAHEYFHNWTGNRITCRDWFQLCLKEGFTVFRDQEFSADQREADVQRIKDVRALRARQFPEDNGPLAHPVRPEEYLKIDNFYTATIYEKGAELIRMLKTILGEVQFRKGCDHYFETLDGHAATVEEFLTSFETATGRDLSHFLLWYKQAGTPNLSVKINTKTNYVAFSQKTPPTKGQKTKQPVVIPIKWQVIGDNGPVSKPQLTILNTASKSVSVPQNSDRTTLSVLQDFSAPVILNIEHKPKDKLRLMGHDQNAFNRWEAGQALALSLLRKMAKSIETGKMPKAEKSLSGYCDALEKTLTDKNFGNEFKSLCLCFPSINNVINSSKQSDPLAVKIAIDWLSRTVGDYLQDSLIELYHTLTSQAPFQPDAASVGRRALRNRCLSLLARRQDPIAATLATEQFKTADNMTDEIAALIAMTYLGGKRVEHLIEEFYDRWQKQPLVIDKWFSLQAMRHHSSGITAIEELTKHPAYNAENPNRARALIGSFAMNNTALFHSYDGLGYQFFRKQIQNLDQHNPGVAARLIGAFEIMPNLDLHRQSLIRTELKAILNKQPSNNVLEITQKLLAA